MLCKEFIENARIKPTKSIRYQLYDLFRVYNEMLTIIDDYINPFKWLELFNSLVEMANYYNIDITDLIF